MKAVQDVTWSGSARRTFVAIGMASLLTAGVALAHGDATGVVAERMDAMKAMARYMKEMGAMVAGKTAFDPAEAQRIAATLHEHCHEVVHLFPPGSGGHHSEAAEAVWTRRAEFDARMQEFDAAVKDLVAASASGDQGGFAAQFKAVGQTCSGCHETFRKEK